MSKKMFEVWTTQDQGGAKVAEYEKLQSAVNRVKKGIKKQEGSFAIKDPSGEFIDLESYLKG